MIKVQVNGERKFEVDIRPGSVMIDGVNAGADIRKTGPRSFHVIKGTRSYTAEIIKMDRQEKSCTVRVNSTIYTLNLSDRFDEVLKQMGMENVNSRKIAELRAPMPGLVLKVLVEAGQEVRKGDNLVVLEAMKMENIIKSPSDLLIRSVDVAPSDKVEKNQVLITFS